MLDYIGKNFGELTEEIDKIRHRVGAPPVKLVCVTKSGSDEELLALVRAGAADIGENRPQEVRRRGDLLREEGLTPALHEIGNLQRNKVKYIIESVALIHSLDSLPLAEEIERQAEKVGRRVPVLIEVNSAGEAAKGGINPEDAVKFAMAVKKFPHLILSGVMTMGPVTETAEEMRPYFRLTKEIFDKIGEVIGYEGEPTLSMGMSDSYEVAIEEGANLVRVGRRLFKK